MLTYIQITAAKPAAKTYKLFDSHGLHLFIQPNGSKLWRFKYRFLDKQKTLHLGPWPGVGLAEVRTQRDEARKKVADGIDPALEKKRTRIAAKYAAANAFEAVAKEWLQKCERDGLAPVTIEKISWLLAKAYPVIGSIPIAQITPHEALAVLRKVEAIGLEDPWVATHAQRAQPCVPLWCRHGSMREGRRGRLSRRGRWPIARLRQFLAISDGAEDPWLQRDPNHRHQADRSQRCDGNDDTPAKADGAGGPERTARPHLAEWQILAA